MKKRSIFSEMACAGCIVCIVHALGLPFGEVLGFGPEVCGLM